MYRKISTGWLKHLEFELADLICIEIAFFLSYYLRHKSILQSTIDWYIKLGCIMLVVDIVVVFFRTYLLGNHELMFLNAIKTQTDDNWYDIQHNEMLWLYNGGKPTYEQWHQLSKDEQTALKIRIASLPIYATYNVFL